MPGVGDRYARILERLDIITVGGLLTYFPVGYIDSSDVRTLSDLNREEKLTVEVWLESITSIRLRGGKTLQKAFVSDHEARIEVVWFNQPYLAKSLSPGMQVLLRGKLNPKSPKPQLTSPEYEIITTSDQTHLGRIVPKYRLTAGLSNRWLRARIKWLIANLDLLVDLADRWPSEFRTKFGLIDLKEALTTIHFPEQESLLNSAKRRLAFDELMEIQLKLLSEYKHRLTLPAAKPEFNQEQLNQFIKELPFTLSTSQKKAVSEILDDISQPHPMRRLLQGDVGSGKTVVAAIAALAFMRTHSQVVLLAPTSILAEQHFATFQRLFKSSAMIELVTASTKVSDKALSKADVLIGTHALLHKKDRILERLGLLIIDEQHRFGVKQRRELVSLEENRANAHLLQMTATPIPRTIALSFFGNYQISVLEKLETRQEVTSFLVPESKRSRAYKWIAEKLENGGQAFWVMPLIEAGDDMAQKSIKHDSKLIKMAFNGTKTAIIHGQLKSSEKSELLSAFQAQKYSILIATTVIEVGIDIPGANIIVIENAENYGLAQLHQLRGRVGRANQEAWCLLFYDETSTHAKERLSFFAREHNGIKIAEYDLSRRGPGEVYGTEQSGIPNLKVARFSDLKLLKETRIAAEEVLSSKFHS